MPAAPRKSKNTVPSKTAPRNATLVSEIFSSWTPPPYYAKKSNVTYAISILEATDWYDVDKAHQTLIDKSKGKGKVDPVTNPEGSYARRTIQTIFKDISLFLRDVDEKYLERFGIQPSDRGVVQAAFLAKGHNMHKQIDADRSMKPENRKLPSKEKMHEHFMESLNIVVELLKLEYLDETDKNNFQKHLLVCMYYVLPNIRTLFHTILYGETIWR